MRTKNNCALMTTCARRERSSTQKINSIYKIINIHDNLNLACAECEIVIGQLNYCALMMN